MIWSRSKRTLADFLRFQIGVANTRFPESARILYLEDGKRWIMKLATRLLARGGIIVAVSAALMGTSVAQAAFIDSAQQPGNQVDTTAGKPSPDEPIEERIEEAVEDVDQEGQAALEELGELDSPEKLDQAERILTHMERATREVRKRAHDRASERFDELNDMALGRVYEGGLSHRCAHKGGGHRNYNAPTG